ncbi:MAG TPA: ChbG/HpnK family deacetylase [Terriglobales bacterium]|nr:ChbG/HpnK family deacetylase [Terriglobales bacterium]
MRVIVNADDLGMSDAVNAAIFAGMAVGTITSATLLANGPCLKTAVSEIGSFPQCSFGVHLNLTEFEPVCGESHKRLASILDDRGCFHGNTIREVTITPALLRGIFLEWCAQIERLIELGVKPNHLDGHHHVHTIPQMLPVLSALRRRYGIKKARISRNLYEPEVPPARGLLSKKWLFNKALRLVGFRTTDIFTELATLVRTCAVRPPAGELVEVMTHPGSNPGSEEARMLEMGWTGSFSYPVTLLSYSAL